jgi:hypothetical protein
LGETAPGNGSGMHDAPSFDPTVTWVRHCLTCGQMDMRELWPTKVAAEQEDAHHRHWACPSCGGSQFEIKLVAKLGGG